MLLYLSFLALGCSFFAPVLPALIIRCAVALALLLLLAYLVCVMRTVSEERQGWLGLLMLLPYLAWLLVVQVLAAVGVNRKVWTRTPR